MKTYEFTPSDMLGTGLPRVGSQIQADSVEVGEACFLVYRLIRGSYELVAAYDRNDWSSFRLVDDKDVEKEMAQMSLYDTSAMDEPLTFGST